MPTAFPTTGARLLLLATAVSLLVAGLAATSGPAPAAAGKHRHHHRAKGPLPPTPAGFFGVSGRRLSVTDLERMQDAGVAVFRTLFHFRLAKRRSNGFYNWREFDRLVGRAASRGIQLLPLLYGTPNWIYDDESTPPIYDARAIGEWRKLLRQLVSRYGPRGLYWKLNPLVPKHPITAWQIWNEPNDVKYWTPAPNPVDYARLLKVSAEAIHSVDPGAEIIAAGVVAMPFGGGIPGPLYLARLAAQPAARASADRFAYHPYARNVRGVRRAMWQARRALNRNGARQTPLWVTEVGWGGGGALDRLLSKTEAGQARALKLTFRMMLRKRSKFRVEKVLWYYWRDQYDPLCLWCRSAGLLGSRYRPKPSFDSFRQLATR